MEQNNKICGGCLMYIQNYLGGECHITDNPVDYNQAACIDYIDDGEPATGEDLQTEKVSQHGKSKRNA